MKTGPRYSIKQYICLGVLGVTLGLLAGILILHLLGAGCRMILIVVVCLYPILTYAVLNGFYAGLVNHYGFKENRDQSERGRT